MRAKNSDFRHDRFLHEVLFAEEAPAIAQINYIHVRSDGQHCMPHVHQDVTETFVCLEGFVRLIVNGEHKELREKDVFSVLPGQVHELLAVSQSRYLELRDRVFDAAALDKAFV